MSKRTWFLVGLALGGGILLQIPFGERHDGDHMAGMPEGRPQAERGVAEGAPAEAMTPRAGERTVVLEVTGMT